MWYKTFGGAADDWGYSVQQTDDGGFIIGGRTESFGAGSDVYLIKTDVSGNEIWSKTFVGPAWDEGNSVQQTDDGGFFIAGRTDSFGAGGADVYLIKTDPSGNEMWSKTFGGDADDWGNSAQQTKDGGFIIAGRTKSFGAGENDVYLIYYKLPITVTFPNGGEELSAGETFEITWTKTDEIGSVKIEYSINGGTDWIEVASTENDGSYNWEVPCDLSDESLVRISDVVGDAYDESDGVFSIEDQDFDGDGTPDCLDNCPDDPNKTEPGICGCGVPDTDSDVDGVADCLDSCPDVANEDQADSDGDGMGDVCDTCPNDASNDIDGDGVCSNVDNCPADFNPDQADTDEDGIGDACDGCLDVDEDLVCDDVDNCPAVSNPDQADFDEDGIGDICDVDADDDGFTFDNDCNDLDYSINPDACDIRKDGIDQDCDGFDRTRGKPCSAIGDDEEPSREGPAKTCNDGIDNDDDGYTDCDDSDCAKKKNCQI